ncbi:MAG: pirin family protein [bacterium]|nr:pirin family protein [bacterium]
MISLRRAGERRQDRRRHHEVWLTFYPASGAEPLALGFGTLRTLDENRLPPGATIAPYPRQEAEVMTYVREGSLAQEDSAGKSGIVLAGEFQLASLGPLVRHKDRNASQTDWAHVLRLDLVPTEVGLQVSVDQKRFPIADRRGRLCLVVSPDGRGGSLRIHQDTLIYSTLLEVGQHVVHELAAGRMAWLHVVQGEVALGDHLLTTGDGAGASKEPTLSFTARGDSEVLLLDMGPPPPPARNRRH